MAQAISLWRLFPTQIESGLSAVHRRSIGEWLADDFTMSSREMLSLLSDMPESSAFRKASERTYLLAEINGAVAVSPAVSLAANGLLERTELPDGAVLVAEFVDWPQDRKIAARHAQELAYFRMEQRGAGEGYDVDTSGLVEPMEALTTAWKRSKENEVRSGARDYVLRGLGIERR